MERSVRSARAAAVWAAITQASIDPEFKSLVGKADQARDSRKWVEGARLYRQALSLYPLHCGYLVQLGHCLKEMEEWVSAEVVYRSALALGAPVSDVLEHLAYVCAADGQGFNNQGEPPITPGKHVFDPLDELATGDDVVGLFALFCQRDVKGSGELIEFLRSFRTRREVALTLIQSADFPRANRELMTLLAETPG